MFVYDALTEAVSCQIEPITLDELKNRGSLYVTKQSRQQMEAQQAEEYKVCGRRERLFKFQKFAGKCLIRAIL